MESPLEQIFIPWIGLRLTTEQAFMLAVCVAIAAYIWARWMRRPGPEWMITTAISGAYRSMMRFFRRKF